MLLMMAVVVAMVFVAVVMFEGMVSCEKACF